MRPVRYHFNWLPFLLFVYTFFTMIFLVNLMIAKMTTRYETIRSQSLRFRSLQLVDLTLQFKDERGAPSPVNLLIMVWSVFQCFGELCFKFDQDVGPVNIGYGNVMGLKTTLRLQAKERTLMKRYDETIRRTKAHAVEEGLAHMHAELQAVMQQMQELSHGGAGVADETVDTPGPTPLRRPAGPTPLRKKSVGKKGFANIAGILAQLRASEDELSERSAPTPVLTPGRSSPNLRPPGE